MSTHEDRIEKTLGSITGDFSGDIPAPESRIEVLLHKLLEGGTGGGFRSVVLSSSQYDLTGKPIIEDPEEGIIYLVPNGDAGDNIFDEWMYLNDAFEKIGKGSIPSASGVIVSVERTGTSDLQDSYTITYANENTDTFTVSKGIARMLPITWIEGYFILETGMLKAHNNYYYTDYIEIPPNTGAFIHVYFNQQARCFLYDAAKNPITIYQNSETDKEYSFVIAPSSDTRYIRLSNRREFLEQAYVQLYDFPATETPDVYSGVEMFERFGVIGDSFASGSIHSVTPSETHYELSWPQMLGRMSGSTAVNYSKGGINTKAWLADTDYGMPKLLADIQANAACGLYMLCLGINDSNNTRTPGGLTYLGTVEDIHDEDYTLNADTFFGNYGRIIQMIQETSPVSRIVLCNFKRIPTTSTAEGYDAFRAAIAEIAQHFGLPYIRLDDDEFFRSSFYMDDMVGSHPTAPQYVGYAKAIGRLLSRAIVNNYDYFKVYTGA